MRHIYDYCPHCPLTNWPLHKGLLPLLLYLTKTLVKVLQSCFSYAIFLYLIFVYNLLLINWQCICHLPGLIICLHIDHISACHLNWSRPVNQQLLFLLPGQSLYLFGPLVCLPPVLTHLHVPLSIFLWDTSARYLLQTTALLEPQVQVAIFSNHFNRDDTILVDFCDIQDAMSGTYSAQTLKKSHRCGIPIPGEVAECVLGWHFRYNFAGCGKYLIIYFLNFSKELSMHLTKYCEVPTFKKGKGEKGKERGTVQWLIKG